MISLVSFDHPWISQMIVTTLLKVPRFRWNEYHLNPTIEYFAVILPPAKDINKSTKSNYVCV